VLSTMSKSSFSKEAVVIEVRVLPHKTEKESSKTSESKEDGGERKSSEDCRTNCRKSIEELYGQVVGEVVILTEVRF
jgi:hypothetical protein